MIKKKTKVDNEKFKMNEASLLSESNKFDVELDALFKNSRKFSISKQEENNSQHDLKLDCTETSSETFKNTQLDKTSSHENEHDKIRDDPLERTLFIGNVPRIVLQKVTLIINP
jgi:ribosomal protein L44E